MMGRSPGNPGADRTELTTIRDLAAKNQATLCSPGNPGADRPRIWVHRAMTFASIPKDQFERVLDDMTAAGKQLSTTAVADEIKRRTGRARTHEERCPHCGYVIRRRQR